MKNEAETADVHKTPEAREARDKRETRGDCSFVLPLFGAGVLVVPFWFAWQWIRTFLQGASREERMTLFMDVFPQTLQHPRGLVMFALVFAAAALLLGLAGRIVCQGFGRLVSAIIILGSLLVAIALTISLL